MARKTAPKAKGVRGAFWKGVLKLSLVTCPVAMTPATTESGRLRFHTYNRATGNRVRAAYYDPETDAEVDADDLRPAYESAEGNFVLFEDDELDAVARESNRTIDIERFIDAGSVPWLWYDTPHYLAPDGAVGAEAFAVIRAAMEDTRTAGFARLVLYRREHPVLIRPRGKGMMLWTLRYGGEVRAPDGLFSAAEEAKGDPAARKLVARLIADRTVAWEPESLMKDPVQADLKALVARKAKGRKTPARAQDSAPEAGTTNVVDITEALRRSLAGEKRKTRPAK